MPFDDPVVAGNTLIRAAIRSPDYVPGVSGWSINRDGTAEFNDVTIRGELLVTDPDGSYVRIYDENPGQGAVVELNPATIPGHTMEPGKVFTDTGVFGPNSASVHLASPIVDNGGFGYLALGSDALESQGILSADEIIIQTSLLTVYNTNGTPGLEVVPDGTAPQNTRMEIDGKELGFDLAVVNDDPGANTLSSATYVTISGVTTASYTKKHANTRTLVFMSVTGFSSAAIAIDFGVQINGVDHRVGKGYWSSGATRLGYSGVALLPAIAAGTYTVTPRWVRTQGAGTLSTNATDDLVTFSVLEVIQA